MLNITTVVAQETAVAEGCGKYSDHNCGISVKMG